jgi:N-hydroxyarylamine O-acetyltransferase
MDIDSYLKRINYNGPVTLEAQTLEALQVAHLLTVPFENLSIHWDEPVVLDDAALFDKVVKRRRGGFCYELNGLFAALLRELGFEVVKLSAAVAREREVYTPDFAHMTLMVSLEERWLVEVGFGASFREPLRLDERGERVQDGASYRIDNEGNFHTLYERKLGGEWKPHYRFTLAPYEYPDFAEMCHFQQYSPESHFRQGRVCSRITEDGRITLSELLFIQTWLDGRREEQTLENEEAFNEVLQEHFGIEPRSLEK